MDIEAQKLIDLFINHSPGNMIKNFSPPIKKIPDLINLIDNIYGNFFGSLKLFYDRRIMPILIKHGVNPLQIENKLLNIKSYSSGYEKGIELADGLFEKDQNKELLKAVFLLRLEIDGGLYNNIQKKFKLRLSDEYGTVEQREGNLRKTTKDWLESLLQRDVLERVNKALSDALVNIERLS